MLHRLGDDPGQDRPIFGRSVSAGIAIASADFRRGCVACQRLGDRRGGAWRAAELSLYAAPAAALVGTEPIPWRPVADVDAEVASFRLE